MLAELIRKNRSYRRFIESEPIDPATMRELVDLGRLSPTGGNKQPLKFFISCDAATNARIFPYLAWAAWLKDWDGPKEGERPAGYIIILGDKQISQGFGVDHGIAAQSIMLGAAEKGLGGCMIGSVKRAELAAALGLPEKYDVLLVLALGKPGEKVELEALKGPDTKYWRDAKSVHHVPKRSLDEVIVKL
jgi:nitroreductase